VRIINFKSNYPFPKRQKDAFILYKLEFFLYPTHLFPESGTTKLASFFFAQRRKEAKKKA